MGGVASLADIAGRARPLALAGEQLLAVLPALQSLFPDGGLRRGTTVVVGSSTHGAGTTSMTLATAAGASAAGSWCAAVGLPALGVVAAAGLGMALERFALVPYPGDQWPAVTAALVDAVDLILIRPPARVRSMDARRLMARARERGVVLVVSGPGWPEPADLCLTVTPAGWRGLGQGHGYLQARSVEVTSTGRRAASRPRRVDLWLPGGDGVVSASPDRSSPGRSPAGAVSAATAV